MHKLTIAFIAAMSLTTFGCKKKSESSDTKAGDPKAAETKAADTKAAEAPKAAGGACAEGLTKNEEGGFCAKIPEGFKAKPGNKIGTTQVDYSYEDANNGVTFTVKKFVQGDFDMAVKMSKDNADKVKGAATEIPGGTYFLYDDQENMWGTAVVHNATTSVECTARMNSKSTDPAKDTVLAICKSLMVP